MSLTPPSSPSTTESSTWRLHDMRRKGLGAMEGVGYVALAVFVVFGVMWGTGTGPFATTSAGGNGDNGGSASNFCVQNPNPTLNLKSEDVEATSSSFLNVTPILVQQGTASSLGATGTSSSGTDYSSDFICGESAEIYVKGTQDGVVGIETTSVSSDVKQSPIKETLKAAQVGTLEARAKDLSQDAFLDNGDKSYQGADGGLTLGKYNNTSAGMNLTTSDTFNVDLQVKTNESNHVIGDGCYVAVSYSDESNPSDYQGDTLSVTQNGKTLTEVTEDVESFESTGMNAYEAIYECSSTIKRNTETFNIQLQTSADTNPTKDIDVLVAGKGDRVSDEDSDNVLTDVSHRDDSSETRVLHSNAQKVTFTVA